MQKKLINLYRGQEKRFMLFEEHGGDTHYFFKLVFLPVSISAGGLKFWEETLISLARRLKREEYWENTENERENTLIMSISWQKAPFSSKLYILRTLPRSIKANMFRAELWCKVLPKCYLSLWRYIHWDSCEQHSKSFQTKHIL